jgi:hypothetical protein
MTGEARHGTDDHLRKEWKNMKRKLTVISAAVVLALAAASSAQAALERVGPVNNAPNVGGFPAWYQDKSGVAFEFCAPETQAELDGGWCLLLPGDANIPESFPANFFDEHFYYEAGNVLADDGNGFRARLVIAQEAAFVNGAAVPGEQMVFTRLRVFIPGLPLSGNYRVVTPFSDVTYENLAAGDRIFDTLDVGVACPATFECSIDGPLGPFLLPSAVAGGAEVPPMPDLKTAPAGTDPWYDALVAGGGGPTADPGTGKKYVADPARVGAITGSPRQAFLARNTDGTTATRNHNTFRIEVSDPATGQVIYALDGENNFSLMGRLMSGALAGKLEASRATYKADGTGAVTALDVFARASATTQARIPGQPQAPAVAPVLNFYDQACGGALTVDPLTGVTTVNDGPYTAPATPAHPMARTNSDYWGQSTPGGLPPGYVCVEDTTARNAAGQVVPAYYLRPVTDDVVVTAATYNGQNNGTLTVSAVSTDPTAALTLTGYGVDLAGGTASVAGLQAPASRVQVASNKGGAALRNTDTGLGGASIIGVPNASADSTTVAEDSAATTLDLLANDTILVNGAIQTVRSLADSGVAVAVTATAPRLGTATVAGGILTYAPNPNANGNDQVSYTVTVDGRASNQSTATINITPVNDAPVAGTTTVGAVVGVQNLTNLIATATDVDGNVEVKDAVITSWPAGLGAQPTPVNGVISFAPTTGGPFNFSYQVVDAAGALSANVGIGTVNVAFNEIITFGKHQYVQNQNRWVVDGTDNIIQGQTITVVYENGWLVGAAAPCDGTATNPDCLVGKSGVDGLGAWGFDTRNNRGAQNPRAGATVWQQAPTHIRAFSTLPSLGGTAAIDIVFK